MKYKVRIQYNIDNKLKSDVTEITIQGGIVMDTQTVTIQLWNDAKSYLVNKFTGVRDLKTVKLVNVQVLAHDDR